MTLTVIQECLDPSLMVSNVVASTGTRGKDGPEPEPQLETLVRGTTVRKEMNWLVHNKL